MTFATSVPLLDELLGTSNHNPEQVPMLSSRVRHQSARRSSPPPSPTALGRQAPECLLEQVTTLPRDQQPRALPPVVVRLQSARLQFAHPAAAPTHQHPLCCLT